MIMDQLLLVGNTMRALVTQTLLVCLGRILCSRSVKQYRLDRVDSTSPTHSGVGLIALGPGEIFCLLITQPQFFGKVANPFTDGVFLRSSHAQEVSGPQEGPPEAGSPSLSRFKGSMKDEG